MQIILKAHISNQILYLGSIPIQPNTWGRTWLAPTYEGQIHHKTEGKKRNSGGIIPYAHRLVIHKRGKAE